MEFSAWDNSLIVGINERLHVFRDVGDPILLRFVGSSTACHDGPALKKKLYWINYSCFWHLSAKFTHSFVIHIFFCFASRYRSMSLQVLFCLRHPQRWFSRNHSSDGMHLTLGMRSPVPCLVLRFNDVDSVIRLGHSLIGTNHTYECRMQNALVGSGYIMLINVILINVN